MDVRVGGMIICTGRRRKMTLGKIELLLAEVKRNKDVDYLLFHLPVSVYFSVFLNGILHDIRLEFPTYSPARNPILMKIFFHQDARFRPS